MGKREKTKLGTPRSEVWDDDWFQQVEQVECDLGHRICGAHAPDCEPCQLKSKHKNGRCRFHGGHPRIGGQKGNRNAQTHGLYSRRLKQCGADCPLWDRCSQAAEDVMELSPRKRPMCFYEQRDYDRMMKAFEGRGSTSTSTAREDDRSRKKKPAGTGSSSSRIGGASPTLQEGEDAAVEDSNPYALILNDTTALLYTLYNRAAAALSVHDLTEETTVTSDNYQMKTTKISAIATAFLRIGRELTTHLKLRHTLVPEPEKDDQPLSLAELMQPIIEQAGDVLDDAIEYERNKPDKDSESHYNTSPEPAPG